MAKLVVRGKSKGVAKKYSKKYLVSFAPISDEIIGPLTLSGAAATPAPGADSHAGDKVMKMAPAA
jgi:hypothetical protein